MIGLDQQGGCGFGPAGHTGVYFQRHGGAGVSGAMKRVGHMTSSQKHVCVCVCGWHLSHSNVTLTSRLLADAGRGPMLLRKQGQEPALSLPVRTPVPSRYSERPRGNSWPLKEGSLSWSLILGFKQTNKQKRTARSPPFRRGIR